jgi:acyl carrier protein
MSSNHQPVYAFVRGLLSEHGHSQDINDDESLIISGLLDSLAVIHIVVFLEQTFNINFAEVYFDQTSFDSVNQILQFIEENQPAKHRNFA